MKKIIILTMAFFAIALLPQTAFAQVEVAPEPVQEKIVKKEVKPKVEKVIYKKQVERTAPKPIKMETEKKVKATPMPTAAQMKKAEQKEAKSNKPIELIVKPLKGSNEKIAKPSTPQKKNLKQ